MADFVRSYGLQLLNRGGQAFDVSQLTSAHVIAFYFSAHWCPPCQHFTPMLKKFVETLQSYGETSLKVIFVSSDKAEHEMWKYVYDAHGDWLVLTYGRRDLKERLERQYQVSGIPQLVVIDSVGRQAVRDARGEVMSASSSSTQVLTTYLGWKTAAGATASVPRGPRQEACGELPPGVRVRIRGLTGAPERNGTEAVVGAFDAEKQRYVVECPDKSLSLRAGNLLQLLSVRVGGGADGEDASQNGTFDATILDLDEETGEFILSRAPGADTAAQADVAAKGGTTGEEEDAEMPATPTTMRARLGGPEGLVLQAEARVLVHGLKAESAQQWNDKVGRILGHDDSTGRYLVEVAAGAQLKIKPDNMRLFPLG